ncbi:hypothetical protein C9374_003984 [Naegleria lovaniensis]|uniref:PARP16 N-terminal domain-containing protein n=1 Tax=Naegleria lovaniensis TaxID=51637 RepID=A0AA88H094_NAELO|nr:uncharacterized protein C9374_003984 [Naegleria lovaniensis]KAG2394220.1 hypothetical protein C9374_003984 [Naegleria lovaniensis]
MVHFHHQAVVDSTCSSLTISKESYDLYCCLLNSAASSHELESIFTPFPMAFIKNSRKDYDRMRDVLSVMPSSDDVFVEPFCTDGNCMTFNLGNDEELSQLIFEMTTYIFHNPKSELEKTVKLGEIRDLFEFILKKQCNQKFSVHYISYHQYMKSNKGVVLLKPDHIFELRYRNMDFSNDFYTGFHASSIENFCSIITNSLQDIHITNSQMSGTREMKTGNAFGIHMCEDVRVARDCSKGGVIHWKNSKLGSHLSAVAQCQVVGKQEHAMKTTSNDENRYLIVQNSDLRIQYILVFSHFKEQKELNRFHHFSRGMIYIVLLIVVVIGSYWKIY